MKLTDPVDKIKGVGEKTAEKLRRAGFFTLADLYYNLPRAYENYQSAEQISEIKPGKVVIRGKISDIVTRRTRRRNFTVTEAIVRDNSDAVRVVWFNQPYRTKAFQEGQEYYFSGEYCLKNGRYQLQSPTTQLVSEVASTGQGSGFQPIYKAHGALNSHFFAKIMANLRPEFAKIPDLLPYSASHPHLCAPGSRKNALFKAHFPATTSEAKTARDLLSYEELFELSLAAALNQNENHKLSAHSCPFNAENTRTLVGSLPFPLTGAQRRATWEILQDLEKTTPMNRLLQGDVGSGKTIVAALAAHQVIKSGHQVALLAPTAVLAAQHAESLAKVLAPHGITVALLTGATKHKTELKKHIASGDADLIIGTHALLTDDTRFHSLALAIIDEQHRFGVNERQKLLLKAMGETGMAGGPQEAVCDGASAGDPQLRRGPSDEARDDGPEERPVEASLLTTKTETNQAEKILSNQQKPVAVHLLSMTATPIPRSLQLAVFGDLDVSVLNELPQGRQPITTTILPEFSLTERLYPAIRTALEAGEQIYWICKAIDDNPATETTSVKKQTTKLQKIFKTAKIAFLHGKMKPTEKDTIMEQFSRGEIQILVSTTVVEVGVNVPNATKIIIMDAENYGLAQLHQLRGRVGRGHKKSDCYLVTTGENPPSRRLRELEKSTDGFYLAEIDLKLRGPGEIYGSLQHGALNLRIATLDDPHLLVAASRDAKDFAAKLAKNPEIMLQYKELQQNISKYQQLTTLN